MDISQFHNYTAENSQLVSNDCLSPFPHISMPPEFVSEHAAFPLKQLQSELKNSTDLESEGTEDKQVDEHVQPLSSGEFV